MRVAHLVHARIAEIAADLRETFKREKVPVGTTLSVRVPIITPDVWGVLNVMLMQEKPGQFRYKPDGRRYRTWRDLP